MPEISVVVCTKNERRYIRACLEALKNQVVKPEIIIVDGHSTDGTRTIARKYTNRIFFDNKKGISDARNIGWKKAKAKIVAYCDTDCRPGPEWTKRILELMDDYGCISGPLIAYDGGFWNKFNFKVWAQIFPVLASKIGYNNVWGANMAFQKEILKKNPFKMKFLEDYEMGKRLRRVSSVKFYNELAIPASYRRFEKEGFYKVCLKYYMRQFFKLMRSDGKSFSGYYEDKKS